MPKGEGEGAEESKHACHLLTCAHLYVCVHNAILFAAINNKRHCSSIKTTTITVDTYNWRHEWPAKCENRC